MTKRQVAMIGLFIIISGIAILLLGCPPPLVKVRPPEPRVEVYGRPPYPEAVWLPGYWSHQRGEWRWVAGHWERRPGPHAVWVPGHWEQRRRGWIWHKGRWEYR
jgi:hypothetical protein